jgi:lysozyme
MRNEALEVAARLCRKFEGLYLKPYLCPANVPTIGWGTIRYPNGRLVTLKDPPITKEQADEYLYDELVGCYANTMALCPGLVGSPPERIGAIVSFVYNLGAGRLKASTLRKRINEKNWPEARKEIKRWVYGGGRILRGLVIRRDAEAALI